MQKQRRGLKLAGLLILFALFWALVCLVEPGQTQTLQTYATTGVSYSFPALSATGSTPWIAVNNVIPSKHAIQLNATGSPTTIAGNLEGSLDGVNATTIVAASATPGQIAWEATGTKPVLFVRFTLTTLSGGASPTVTPIYAGSH